MVPKARIDFLNESYSPIVRQDQGAQMFTHDAELADLVEGIVMIIIATRDDNFRPAVGRSIGAALRNHSELIDLFIPAVQWPETVENAGLGAPISVTFSRPTNYETVQIKGNITQHERASVDDIEYAKTYLNRVRNVLAGLGVSREQIEFLATGPDLHRVQFRPEQMFRQTPGPGAGARIAKHRNA